MKFGGQFSNEKNIQSGSSTVFNALNNIYYEALVAQIVKNLPAMQEVQV